MDDPTILDSSASVLHQDVPGHNYLFTTQSARIEFVIIETEFSELNDYCVVCLTGTLDKLNELKLLSNKYSTWKEEVVEADSGDITTNEVLWSLSEVEIPAWEEHYNFTAKAMSLVLLSFFTEKSLKDLCTSFAPDGTSLKPRGGESKIGAYIRCLREQCSFDFIEPQEFVAVREKCRQVRNSFAHGDWEEIKEEVSDTSLPQAFGAVSNLFSLLETKIYPDDIESN
jgi:hypothetical protein